MDKPLSASALKDGMHRRPAISLNNLGNLDSPSKVLHLKSYHANDAAIEMYKRVVGKGSSKRPPTSRKNLYGHDHLGRSGSYGHGLT